MGDKVTVALSKGKLLDPTLALFQKAGYLGPEISSGDRKLAFEVPQSGLSFWLSAPRTFHLRGGTAAAEGAWPGKDLLLEQQLDVYEPLDLRIGWCRISVAALAGLDERNALIVKTPGRHEVSQRHGRHFNRQGTPVGSSSCTGQSSWRPCWAWRIASWTWCRAGRR